MAATTAISTGADTDAAGLRQRTAVPSDGPKLLEEDKKKDLKRVTSSPSPYEFSPLLTSFPSNPTMALTLRTLSLRYCSHYCPSLHACTRLVGQILLRGTRHSTFPAYCGEKLCGLISLFIVSENSDPTTSSGSSTSMCTHRWGKCWLDSRDTWLVTTVPLSSSQVNNTRRTWTTHL